jgi:hypothetical protein
MGWNTLWLVNNDFSDSLKNNPKVGDLLSICPSVSESDRIVRAYGINPQALRCVFQQHADVEALAVVGNLNLRIVASTAHYRHVEPNEVELELLEKLASKHGYDLHKKRTK